MKVTATAAFLDDASRRFNEAAGEVIWEAVTATGDVLGRGSPALIMIEARGVIVGFRSSLGEFNTPPIWVDRGVTIQMPPVQIVQA